MLRYSGPFAFLAGIPLLYYFVGPLSPLADIMILLFALIVAEGLPARHVPAPRSPLNEFRLLPLLYIPLQLGVIIWAINVAAISSPSTLIVLASSVGVTAGVFGMLCAHELAHSRHRFDRFVALAMLTATSNRQFRISHVYGHHRRAGTERDPATAKLGESFYVFLARTLPSQWKEAWEFEQRRCASRGLGRLENRVVQDIIVIVLVYTTISAKFGTRGALFFLFENTIAIVVLELFNYIAHYGLVRGKRVDGRPEPFMDACSWNSSKEFANLLIFNMGRHSDHHRRPTASYQVLSGIKDAPELPFGYAASILLALFPPLWRRVMDPHIFRLKSNENRYSCHTRGLS
jgi:alkane 1-monooxygenase